MKQYGKHDLRSYLDDEDDLWSDYDECASDYDETYEQEETNETDEGRKEPSEEASTEQPSSKPPPAFLLSDAFESSVIISEETRPQSKPSPSSVSPHAGSSDTRRLSADSATNKKASVASIVVPYVRPRREEVDIMRRNGKDVFSALDDDSIVRIATYLPLRDVSSLSCASRYLDVALSSDFLYCRKTDKDSEKKFDEDADFGVTSLLPSLRDAENFLLPYGPSRPRGVSRKYALEAEAYGSSVHKSCTFRLVEEISDVASRPNDVKLIDQSTLAYTSGAPEIVVHRLKQRSSFSSTNSPPPRTVVTLPGCADVRRSAFGRTRHGLCATLSNSSSNGDGGGDTILSVTDISSKSVSWQKRVEGSRTMFSVAFKPSSVEFGGADDEWLLVNTGGSRCSVLDVARGGVELWSMNEEEENDGPLDSCLFFGNNSRNDGSSSGPSSSPLVVGMMGGSIKVYDVRRHGGSDAGVCIARAGLRSYLSAPSTIVQAVALGEQLFVASHGGRLFCGTPITSTTTTTDSLKSLDGRGEKSIPLPTSFQMEKVKRAPPMTSMTVGNGKLYLCNGKRIDVVDPRMMSSLWASYDCGSRNVDALLVDDTKLILRSNRYGSQSIHIIPMDAFVQNSPFGAAVEVAFPHLNHVSTRLNVGTLALRGDLLAVPLCFNKMFYEQTNGGEIRGALKRDHDVIRVLDIQHVDESQDSYHAVRSENSAQWELKNMYQNQLYAEKNAKEFEEESKKEEEERIAEAKRALRISRRKEAKKEAGRRFKATEKASSKQRASARRTKDVR